MLKGAQLGSGGTGSRRKVVGPSPRECEETRSCGGLSSLRSVTPGAVLLPLRLAWNASKYTVKRLILKNVSSA